VSNIGASLATPSKDTRASSHVSKEAPGRQQPTLKVILHGRDVTNYAVINRLLNATRMNVGSTGKPRIGK
jgi:hypothetical protein